MTRGCLIKTYVVFVQNTLFITCFVLARSNLLFFHHNHCFHDFTEPMSRRWHRRTRWSTFWYGLAVSCSSSNWTALAMWTEPLPPRKPWRATAPSSSIRCKSTTRFLLRLLRHYPKAFLQAHDLVPVSNSTKYLGNNINNKFDVDKEIGLKLRERNHTWFKLNFFGNITIMTEISGGSWLSLTQ